MWKKVASGIMLILLIGILVLAFDSQVVKAPGTIHIRADGSVDPPDVAIQRDGDIYNLTDNISGSIDILRDNIIVDGGGYTLKGTGVGIRLYRRTNVTITNMEIKMFWYGIDLGRSSNCAILENNITACVDDALSLVESSDNNRVSGNNIADSQTGIDIHSSSCNIISGNNIANNTYCGMQLWESSCNRIFGNTIVRNHLAVYLVSSRYNTIFRNNMTENNFGTTFTDSSNNIISGNNITNNDDRGIGFIESVNNTICENNITRNSRGIALRGYDRGSFNNNFYHNNIIDNWRQAEISDGGLLYTNVWDDGYPSGGNYWSDYAGVDEKNGQNQDQLGGDGIGDTPHAIEQNNTDRYPFMNPCEMHLFIYSIHLESREDNYDTSNLGKIVFESAFHSLPDDVTKVSGIYCIRYNPVSGYGFDHWETCGDVSVVDRYSQSTCVIVSGDGCIRATYVVTYNIHLTSKQTDDVTSNRGTLVFNGTPYSLPKNIAKPSGTYSIQYDSYCHEFDHWETSGDVSVVDHYESYTSANVGGDGTLRAIYKKVREPKEIIVDGGGDCLAIQGAINAACDGDIIRVRGTYVQGSVYDENLGYYTIPTIVVNKSVSLIGEGRDKTIVRPTAYDPIPFNVTANQVKITGIYFYRAQIHLHKVEECEISHNIVDDGLYHFITLYESYNNTIAYNRIRNGLQRYYRVRGIALTNSSGNVLSYNTITEQYLGVSLNYSSNNIVCYNTFSRNTHSMSLSYSSNNSILHNNFIHLPKVWQAHFGSTIYLVESFNNTWNDVYPYAGNCWRWYNGTDEFRGPDQNETGSDGIGDTPYKIDIYDGDTIIANDDNQDFYPSLTFFWVSGMDILPIDPTAGFPSQSLEPYVRSPECPIEEWMTIDVSEYMIGSIGVGIILPESNGIFEPSTEDWTDEEIEKVLIGIHYALDWWASRNPYANVSFVTEAHLRVPTNYEPISGNINEWLYYVRANLSATEAAGLFFSNMKEYAIYLREKLNTDWAFAILVVDSSNDTDGCFPDGSSAFACGPYICMTYDNDGWGIENMDRVCAHEIGHIFGACDEYIDQQIRRGYLNVPSIPHSGCLMDNCTWNLSGEPHGCNGTWGQVGWHDADDDGILDIVDTFPQVYLDFPTTIANELNFTGIAAVTPYLNMDPFRLWQEKLGYNIRRSFTVNEIRSVQFRINEGEWLEVVIASSYKQAVVNFTFLTPELEPGNHTIEVRATNQWGNSGYFNVTITIPKTIHDTMILNVEYSKTVVCEGHSMNINVTVWNQGESSETFDLSLYANETEIETKQTTLESGSLETIAFEWNTTGFEKYKNYIISAYAHPVEGETDIGDNEFTDGKVLISIVGDIAGPEGFPDRKVDMRDIGTAAQAFGSYPEHPRWNPIADINNDGKVDMKDIGIVAKEFGRTV